MAITEEERHRLYLRLEEVLGPEQATTLMEHLPPVGWADVATKRDIDTLAVATKRDIDALAAKTTAEIQGLGHELRAEFYRGQRTLLLAMLTSNTALAAIALAAGQLS